MYILSVPAIRTLTKLFEQDFQHFLWLEDVYLTGKSKLYIPSTVNFGLILWHTPVSIVSDTSAASNGGKWELMHYVH